MRKNKLNNMALKARMDEFSLWQLKAEFWPLIEKVYETTWHSVHKIARIEEECEREIENAVRDFTPDSGDFEPFVKRKLYRVKMRLLRETARLKRQFNFVDVDSVDIYDEYDGLAAVEMRIEVKEKIARMATDDPRRNWALNAWMNGITDVSDLARRMTETLGKNFETNRKFLTRFKAECRQALTDAV